MNDLLKLFSKSLKPFGYHIRPRKGLNLLDVPNIKYDPSVRNMIKAQDKSSSGFCPEMNQITIFLRTCLRENRNIDARPRVTGESMSNTAFVCIHSLVQSINDAMPEGRIKLVVMDDHSDPDMLERIKKIVASCEAEFEILSIGEQGQGASLYEQFRKAREEERGLCYFVEDDYLHESDAIEKLWRFSKYVADQLKSHCVIYPQEHRILYTHHYPSYILLGDDRHWRTIRHATHTFLTHSDIVREHWADFENTKFVGDPKKRRKGSEDKTTNQLFKKVPGFSPLLPLAVHLQFEGTLPYLYDWRPLCGRVKENMGSQ